MSQLYLNIRKQVINIINFLNITSHTVVIISDEWRIIFRTARSFLVENGLDLEEASFCPLVSQKFYHPAILKCKTFYKSFLERHQICRACWKSFDNNEKFLPRSDK